MKYMLNVLLRSAVIILFHSIGLTFEVLQANTKGNVNEVVLKNPSEPVVIWWYPRLFPHFDDFGNIYQTERIYVNDDDSCVITRNRSYLNGVGQFSAFIFYGTDFIPSDVPLPRSNHQLWSLIHEESPMNNYMFSHGAGIKLFNLTATFSRYSDYPLTSQFINSKEYLLKTPRHSVVEKNDLMGREDLAPVLYLQSHCGVASDRDRYVAKLMKFVKIDSYGKCLNNKELPETLRSTSKYKDDSLFEFISKYKFHLAFENAICKDYMTEKLFRTLHIGAVPIYFGSPVVKDWMPNDLTLIDVNEYETPEDLASHINYLNGNDSAYSEYLAYKDESTWTKHLLRDELERRDWRMNEPGALDFLSGFERFVCRQVIRNRDDESTSRSSRMADPSHMGCPQPHPVFDEVEISEDYDEWSYYQWEDVYWNGLDDALALRDMMLAGETKSKRHSKYLRHY